MRSRDCESEYRCFARALLAERVAEGCAAAVHTTGEVDPNLKQSVAALALAEGRTVPEVACLDCPLLVGSKWQLSDKRNLEKQ